MSSKDKVLSEIRQVAETKIPQGAQVILFGSQARGDAHEGSDWDVLILIDKQNMRPEEYEMYSYPFWELGWQIDAMIHPVVYTLYDWENNSSPLFRENIKREGVSIC